MPSGTPPATNRVVRLLGAAVAATAVVVATVMAAAGQGAPQTYQAPRTPDGRPDLQGIWQAVNAAVWNLEDHTASLGVPAGMGVVDGEIPYLPSARARRQENSRNRLTDDPETQCYLVGVPRLTYMPYPFQIVQTPRQTTFLYEYVHAIRNVYMEGPHPEGPIQWWLGDSRGRWEGDTLVVDVVHFTDQTWLDRSGNYHSDALHVVERYTLTGPDHMLYEATIEDPKVFSRPWTISMPLYRRQEENARLLEYECFAYAYSERQTR